MRILNRTYTESISKSQKITIERAKSIAKKEKKDMLPDGQKTKGHFFYSLKNKGIKIGYLWIIIEEDSVYIADLYIFSKHRSKGYGTKAISWVKKRAKKLKRRTIWLHVFGHNEGAQKFYCKLKFKPASISMRLDLYVVILFSLTYII